MFQTVLLILLILLIILTGWIVRPPLPIPLPHPAPSSNVGTSRPSLPLEGAARTKSHGHENTSGQPKSQLRWPSAPT
eukprot:359282-Pyramimonas_sp.AAC.1